MQNHTRARFTTWRAAIAALGCLIGSSAAWSQGLPAPVRPAVMDSVAEFEPIPPAAGIDWDAPVDEPTLVIHEAGPQRRAVTVDRRPSAPHWILRSGEKSKPATPDTWHPSHPSRRAQSPTIPAGVVEPRWKTPYAYGYFGAKPRKHWSHSHGYRDVYHRWTYR